jgi:hypothetical protein
MWATFLSISKDILAGIGLFSLVFFLLCGKYTTGSGKVKYTGPFYSKSK